MFDRMIRADLYTSNRYIDLHDDSQRVLFHVLLARADDFGCQSGDMRELLRVVEHCSQLHSLEALGAALQALADVDLIRCYEVGKGYQLRDPHRWREHEGKAGIYIPRFRSQRTYSKRHFAPSPWCDQQALEGQVRQRYGNPNAFGKRYERGNAATEQRQDTDRSATEQRQDNHSKLSEINNVAQTTEYASKDAKTAAEQRQDSDSTVTGLAQGVGLKEKKKNRERAREEKSVAVLPQKNPTRLPADWTIPAEWVAWCIGFALDRGFDIGDRGARELADRFRDHFVNKRGPDGAALDWLARWRTWCGRAKDFGELATLSRDHAAGASGQPEAIARAR